MIKYENVDITDYLNARPDMTTGFEFLTSFGLSMNDINISLPLARFVDLIKKEKTLSIDSRFVGKIYDIKKNARENALQIVARHCVYDLSIAEAFAYTATDKNPVLAIKEILLQFISEDYIDVDSFDVVASSFSDIIFDFDISSASQQTPMNIIAAINELLSICLYIEDSKIKIYYVKETPETGGIEMTSNIILQDAIIDDNDDFKKDKVVINYFNLSDVESTLSSGSGLMTKTIDVDASITMSSTVAQTLAARALVIYNRDKQTIEIVLKKSDLIKVGKTIIYDGDAFVIKNITESNNEYSISGIGGI